MSNVGIIGYDKVKNLFAKIVSFNRLSQHNPETEVIRVKRKFKGMIWIPVDKNARKIAAVCPVRLKYEIDKCFIQEKKHLL